MQRINRDAYVAIFLLMVCGVFFWASFDIRQPDYGTLAPSTWPRLIIAVLAVLSGIFLVQSLRRGGGESDDDAGEKPKNFREWVSYWRNVIWCFALFLFYLVTLPVLGALIGGVTFVFLLFCVLGGWSLRNLVLHAVVAMLTVGGMWSLFTYGLGVILPRGIILNPY